MFASLVTSLALKKYRDSRLNRPESVSLASLARQLEKWFPLYREGVHSLYFYIYIRRLEVSKNNNRNVKE